MIHYYCNGELSDQLGGKGNGNIKDTHTNLKIVPKNSANNLCQLVSHSN